MSLLAVIGGAEAHRFLREGTISGKELGSRSTPFGEANPIFQVDAGDTDFLFMSRHGVNAYELNSSATNHRANLYALKDAGAQYVVSWTGCGSIAEGFPTGSFAVLEDVIDETRTRARTYFPQSGLGFLRQNPIFCPILQNFLGYAMQNARLDIRFGGVYLCTEGPRLDTAAEIRKYQTYGAELIGTSLVPEVFLARELELCYASFAIIANRAEGTVHRGYVAGELFEGLLDPQEREKLNDALATVPEFLKMLAQAIGNRPPAQLGDCPCPTLLDGARKAGKIDNNWREYIVREMQD